MSLTLNCLRCDYTVPLRIEDGYPYDCPECGYVMDVSYGSGCPSRQAFEACFASPGPFASMWRYSSFLPIPGGAPEVNLHEGGTPLLRVDALSAAGDGVRVVVKDDARNPTGSFKDRSVGLAVHYAVRTGASKFIVASSGNAAVSTSAMAASTGTSAIVLTPHTSRHSSKLRQAWAYGARTVLVDGDFNDVYRVTQDLARRLPVVDVTTTFRSPIATEANKTVAYEMYEQMKGEVPDWVLVPVSSGPLLWGIWKGYRELADCGLSAKIPHMVAVQAAGCAPTARAFRAGLHEVEAWLNPQTVADGIADGLLHHEVDGALTLKAIYASGGAALAIPDPDILAAVEELARKAGVFAEPTGAISLAGLRDLERSGMVKPGETAAVIVTGHGLKRPNSLGEPDLPPVAPNIEAVCQYLGI
jgi:threonine synthase